MSGFRGLVAFAALIGATLTAVGQNTFPTNGSVGIGTTAPSDYLTVSGTDPNKVGIGISNSNASLTALSLFAGGSSGFGITGWSNASVIEGESPNGLVLGAINAQGNGVGGPISFQIGRNTVAAISTAGYFGIGTTNPGAPLSVNTTSPGQGYQSVAAVHSISGTIPVGGLGSGLRLGWGSDVAGPTVRVVHGGDFSNAGFGFSTWQNAAEVEAMRIVSTGNVGIGTTAPGYRLDVSGQVHASGGVVFPDGTTQTTAFNPAICGGDYAESVDATGNPTAYGPGDVLVLAPDGGKDVVKSTEPYSTLVAGIYSTRPGYVGRRQVGPKGADEIPMAMIGIVPTKVSAEGGAIRRGDLLVTSSTPGYAMKGTDRGRMLGAVVGKAMGALDSGTGVIEVLVTLQ